MDANPYEYYEFTLQEQYELIEEQIRFNQSLYDTTKDINTPESNDALLKLIAGLEEIHVTLGLYELVLGITAESEEDEETPEKAQCVTF